ncbi:MAG: T9SS type A sorting domain-containing protein [Flavobacteriales bacterium]|nr:T9SS type A sorting domain-containing protein [Flavobacteriales bacterium]
MLAILAQPALAQWTYDPENPQVVCDVVNTQQKVQQVPDGDGGTYVFWLDGRLDYYNHDVYGQHYNALGIPMWEESGREIMSYYSHIYGFAVVRTSSDGEMIIGVHSGITSIAPDSLRFQKLNAEGDKMWPSDLLAAKADGCVGNYFLGFENFSFYRDEIGYTVNFVPTYCGGSDGCRITHFNSDGILTGLYNGEPEGNQYYIGNRGIDKTYDGTGDTYIWYTGGNGLGAHAFCMRVNLAGDSVFAPVDVLDGTNGLNYQYSALSDENGITVCFQSTGEGGSRDMFMRRLNGDGSYAWGGEIINVCTAEGAQGNFHWIQDDDYYYIVWADNRPGVLGYYAIYAQKIEKTTGAIQWIEDGVEVFNQNTYLPYPKCTMRDDGKIVVVNEATASPYLNAQLLNQNGETEWTQDVSLGGYGYLPFYTDYTIINSDENVIVAWSRAFSGGGADGIFIAQVAEPDMTTYVSESVTACDSYEVNGEIYDASGVYEIMLPGDTLLTLTLTINSVVAETTLNGNTLSANNSEGNFTWINCNDNSTVASGTSSFTPSVSGEYALVVELNGCTDTSACSFVNITGIESVALTDIRYPFPNPFESSITIDLPLGTRGTELIFTDVTGKTVLKIAAQGGRQIVDTSSLASGSYTCIIKQAHETKSFLVMKK